MITATPFLATAADAKLEDWGPLEEALPDTKTGSRWARGSRPWPVRWRGPGGGAGLSGDWAGIGGGSGLTGVRAAG